MRIGHPVVSQGSKAYILRSTLDPVLIARTTLTNKRILEVEAAEAPDDVDGAEPGMRAYGSLIAWNSADQLSTLGLILVSGKVISDSASVVPFHPPFPSTSYPSPLPITPLVLLRNRSDVVA